MRICYRCQQEFNPGYGIQIHCGSCIERYRVTHGDVIILSRATLDSVTIAQIKRLAKAKSLYVVR